MRAHQKIGLRSTPKALRRALARLNRKTPVVWHAYCMAREKRRVEIAAAMKASEETLARTARESVAQSIAESMAGAPAPAAG